MGQGLSHENKERHVRSRTVRQTHWRILAQFAGDVGGISSSGFDSRMGMRHVPSGTLYIVWNSSTLPGSLPLVRTGGLAEGWLAFEVNCAACYWALVCALLEEPETMRRGVPGRDFRNPPEAPFDAIAAWRRRQRRRRRRLDLRVTEWLTRRFYFRSRWRFWSSWWMWLNCFFLRFAPLKIFWRYSRVLIRLVLFRVFFC